MQGIHWPRMGLVHGAQCLQTGFVGQQGDPVQARQDAIPNRGRGALDGRDDAPDHGHIVCLGDAKAHRQAAPCQEVVQDVIRPNFQQQLQVKHRAGHDSSPA